MKRLVIWLVGIVGIGLSGGAFAATECNGVIGGSVVGGVVVNANAFCMLDGAHVSGGVQVKPGGLLIACGSNINGGLVTDGALNLIIGVGADEEVPPVNFHCPGNVINGGMRISNTGTGVLDGPPSIAIERNVISGAVHLTGNQGLIVVSNDTISGGLFCAANAHDLDDEGTPSVISGQIRCTFGD